MEAEKDFGPIVYQHEILVELRNLLVALCETDGDQTAVYHDLTNLLEAAQEEDNGAFTTVIHEINALVPLLADDHNYITYNYLLSRMDYFIQLWEQLVVSRAPTPVVNTYQADEEIIFH